MFCDVNHRNISTSKLQSCVSPSVLTLTNNTVSLLRLRNFQMKFFIKNWDLCCGANSWENVQWPPWLIGPIWPEYSSSQIVARSSQPNNKMLFTEFKTDQGTCKQYAQLTWIHKILYKKNCEYFSAGQQTISSYIPKPHFFLTRCLNST